MTPWVERIQQSSSREASERIQRAAQTARETSDLDPASEAIISRAEVATEYALTQIFNADAALVSEASLVPIEEKLTHLAEQLDRFLEGSTDAEIIAVNDCIERLLPTIANLPAPRRGRGRTDTAEATATVLDRTVQLEATARSSISEIEAESKHVRDLMVGHVAKLLEEIDTIRQDAEQLQSNLSDAQTDFDVSLTAQKSRIDGFVQAGEASIREIQSSLVQDYRSEREALAAEAESKLTKQRESWDERFSSLEANLAARLDFFTKREHDANRILGTTAASSTAGAYLEDAKEQAHRADIWRRMSVAGWIGALVLGIWAFHEINGVTSQESTSWLIVISASRVALAGIALAFAVWMNSQSSHHRDRERASREMANQLTTLRPFLSELPDEDQHKAIVTAIQRYFPGKQQTEVPTAALLTPPD